MINLVDWAERGRIPDALLRVGMRRLLVKRLVQDQVNATPAGKAQRMRTTSIMKCQRPCFRACWARV